MTCRLLYVSFICSHHCLSHISLTHSLSTCFFFFSSGLVLFKTNICFKVVRSLFLLGGKVAFIEFLKFHKSRSHFF